MRSFFAEHREIVQSLPAQSRLVARLAEAFPLRWTHYVWLLALRSPNVRRFYAKEALRGGSTSSRVATSTQDAVLRTEMVGPSFLR